MANVDLIFDVCPSGKLPITIEKKFEDSSGHPYIPEGEEFYMSWDIDSDMSFDVYNNNYDEGVLLVSAGTRRKY